MFISDPHPLLSNSDHVCIEIGSLVENGSISSKRSVSQPHLQRILRHQTPCQLLQGGPPRTFLPFSFCLTVSLFSKIASFLHLLQIFGFEEIESPDFVEFKVIWLNLASVQLHLIERNPSSRLPEGPWSATSPVADPSHLPRGHHICFSVSNFESVVRTLKVPSTSLSHLNLYLLFFFL